MGNEYLKSWLIDGWNACTSRYKVMRQLSRSCFPKLYCSTKPHYKNRPAFQWLLYRIEISKLAEYRSKPGFTLPLQIRVELYSSNGTFLKYIEYNASSSDNSVDWFSSQKFLSSSWNDLSKDTPTDCWAIEGG